MIDILTDKGNLKITEVFSMLMYGSYKANRGYGLSHEQLVSIGIGTDEFKAKYEAETIKTESNEKE